MSIDKDRVERILNKAADQVESESQGSIRIEKSARDVLRTWVKNHPEKIQAKLKENWTEEQFVTKVSQLLRDVAQGVTSTASTANIAQQADEGSNHEFRAVGSKSLLTRFAAPCNCF